ncbi:hypothetical protein [Massilia sp. METH4]|uniref:hypothetical protein n=1 Tax=Massilia sp. METH4 TaxID=3123041 RepID=UPI0030CB5E29
MLGLPEEGMSYSVSKHNVDIGILCDWIEASVLFDDNELSKSDVIDILVENEVYASQGFASEVVDIAWAVLRQRLIFPGADLQFKITGHRITRVNDWETFPAYAFCLILSCLSYLYPQSARALGYDFTGQGSLFERLAFASLSKSFPNWTVKRVGWAPDNPLKLKEAVGSILSDLNEVANGDIHLHVTEYANELGLDILAFCSFSDNHASFPVIMMQCASGKNWEEKRHTPDFTVWRKIVNFNSQPLKAFAIPYAFTNADEFRAKATKVDGLFMDRYRLIIPTAGRALQNLDNELRDDLLAWITPRVRALPRADV